MSADNQKLCTLKILLGIDTEDASEDKILSVYLRIAEQKVINRLYPFSTDVVFVPVQYTEKIIEIAQYLYLRRGSEGETSHVENGISRSYEDAGIPDSLLKDIVPMVGTVI